ncbi:hypothetical protein ScPMuIL_002854 [Solemya velum]
MPLLILCGLPSSGKSRRAQELDDYLSNELNKKVNTITDHYDGRDKNVVYGDPGKEKNLRATLKSSVQRLLNKEDVVVVDSMNYIKGCRYELYCVTKAAHTPHCVVQCDTNAETACQWNQARDETDRYTQEIFDALVMRFEPPAPNNRWDSPLFLVHPGDDLPFQQISDSLFSRKPPPPNMATQSQPLSSTNFLYELDKTTQEAITVLLEAQKTSVAGDQISVPGAKDKLALCRIYTLAELQRHRRQFITYTKLHPVQDTSKIANMFVQYLNNCLR